MKVSDMIGAGFGMNVITLLTTAAAINTFAIPIFGLDSFPEWAVASLPVNQTCIAQMWKKVFEMNWKTDQNTPLPYLNRNYIWK